MATAIKVNLVLLLFFLGFFAEAQPANPKVGEYSNHVVIGAFGTRENAVHLVNSTKEAYPDVVFEINSLRQLDYVYVLKTDDRVQAFALARKLRKESKFFDTWVFYGVLGQDLNTNQGKIFRESSGLDINKAVEKAATSNEKIHFEAIRSVKEKAVGLDATTKVIVFKDDKEGREALRSLGYEIEEGKPVGGFFDSKKNILAINASESQIDEPFHEGLRPVVKFLKTKNPQLFEQFARQASAMKHPIKGKTYGELAATPDEALGNMLADVKAGLFDNVAEPRGEATILIGNILQSLGIELPEIAVSSQHLRVTANNLAIAVLEATGFDRNVPVNSSRASSSRVSQQDIKLAEEVKAYSTGAESSGLDLNTAIEKAVDGNEKMHYEAIKSIKAKAVGLDATTKVIVFKDDKEGREALRSLGYDIEEGKPVGGFFDSKNNILAINASESKTDEPFHEGLRPVVKFLKKKNPELFEQFARQASAIKHPAKGKTYGELAGTPEEALGNMLADVNAGLFDNADQPRGEATSLIGKILQSLGVEPPEIAISSQHLKATANNLAIAVREATGFDADGNRKFKFDIFNTVDRRKVVGRVDLVTEAGRKLISYQGNELIQLKRKDVSGEIILSCEILGYRKLLFKLNYDNPFLSDGVQKGEDEEAIIPFGLVRLQKGDIAVMYNVFFYQDAAIIRPESKYEINNLLGMMNENAAYKIRIHGHTNGNSAGKIITMGDSKNYFSLSGTKEGRGSAKDLSEKRAEVIQQYLVDNGISVGRTQIKAWGGKRPLYDKNDNQARANVRVEIEILEN